MPQYDYKCPECELVGEVIHGMNEDPVYLCPDCEVEMKRVYNTFGVCSHKTTAQQKINDKLRRDSEMKTEMKEEYGIESFQPIAARGLKDVYDDVKNNGDMVKEQMQASKEKQDAALKKKQRDWTKKALKRAPERSREKVERKQAEAAKKRAIRL